MSPHVSIILSLVGDDRILRRCVTALNAHDAGDIEVIVADYTYTGYAKALERKLKIAHDRLHVIKGSPGVKRWNRLASAVAVASGRYVMFLDPSQWLEDEAISTLAECMDSTGADIVEMRSVKCLNGVAVRNDNPVPPEIPVDRLVAGDELRQLTHYIGEGSYISRSIYDKMYRREILCDAIAIEYHGDRTCDDVLNIHYLRHARNMVFMSYAGLNYNWQDQSGRYRYSSLEDAKHAYRLKHICGQDEICIREELYNSLCRHAHGLIVDNGWTREATQFFLERELSDPLWRQAQIDVNAEHLVAQVDKRDRWLDLTKVLGRLLH